MKKQLIINEVYQLDDKTKVVFLGYQDIKHFGFFRELSNPDTFFGYRISKIHKIKT